VSESGEISYQSTLEVLTASQRRRAIYERAASRFRALGTPIDTDPAFTALVDRWIDGLVEMAEVARSYAEIRDTLRQARLSVAKHEAAPKAGRRSS
jgi:hypothetical protein